MPIMKGMVTTIIIMNVTATTMATYGIIIIGGAGGTGSSTIAGATLAPRAAASQRRSLRPIVQTVGEEKGDLDSACLTIQKGGKDD